ncbi:MAG: PEP-CTERM sorting domain-containing protein [Gammaproteobacteria bacterium]
MTFNASFIRTDFQSQWPDPTVIPQWGDATLAGALGLALLKSVENVVNRGACDTATLVGCTRNVFIPFDYFDNANTAVLLLQAFPEDGFLTGTTPNNVTSGGLYVDFAKVPEPTTLALLGLGIAGLGFRKKTQ